MHFRVNKNAQIVQLYVNVYPNIDGKNTLK